MEKELQEQCNGLHSGTKIEEYSMSNLRTIEVHLEPVTKKVVIMETEVVSDGGDCIDKESEVIAVFKTLSDYNFIKNNLKKYERR
jgi:hypothetical protein